METKTKIISGILFLSLFLTMGFIMAESITVATPSASDILNGTYNFSLTVSGDFSSNATNCTWATTTDGVFAVYFNTSLNQTLFWNSTDTSTLTETASTTLNMTCYNSTTQSLSTTLTIGIDNTAPTCSFTIDNDEVEYLDPIGVATTQGSSDTTTLTNAWTLFDPSGGSQQTSTSSEPTFTGADFDEIGESTLQLIVTDAVGGAGHITACTNKTIFVRGNNGDSITPQLTNNIAFFQKNKIPLIVISVVIIFIILVAVSFMVISKSK